MYRIVWVLYIYICTYYTYTHAAGAQGHASSGHIIMCCLLRTSVYVVAMCVILTAFTLLCMYVCVRLCAAFIKKVTKHCMRSMRHDCVRLHTHLHRHIYCFKTCISKCNKSCACIRSICMLYICNACAHRGICALLLKIRDCCLRQVAFLFAIIYWKKFKCLSN